MRKRNTGYILLVLLVITGLAGTLNTSTLSSNERKMVLNDLKETRSQLLKTVKGLSSAQLTFRESPEKWSINDCILNLARTEKDLWTSAEAALKQPGNNQKHSVMKIKDEDILNGSAGKPAKLKKMEALQPGKASRATVTETLDAFKKQRNNLIDYLKITTENLREHMVQTQTGCIDAYQVALLISAYSNSYIRQINEVKADPGFPKQ